MTDSEPLLVLKQVSDKRDPRGTRYRLLGLGMVAAFDAGLDLFRISGVPADRFTDYINLPLEDELIETALRLESLEDWQPFVREDRVLYRVNAQRRDQAFRDVVLDNYDQTCAVTGQKFVYSATVEADAAHIIGKGFRGTDDPRNGLAMSKSVHWAFDKGIFMISDQFEVIIHSKAKFASFNAFPLMAADGKGFVYLPTLLTIHIGKPSNGIEKSDSALSRRVEPSRSPPRSEATVKERILICAQANTA